MLSYETERRLKSLLQATGEGEQQLESLRQRLCSIPDFAPFSAFQRVDRDAKDFVNSSDILAFLRHNNVFGITEAESYRLVKFFDSDEDGRLSFEDFEQIFLPCEDNFLRQRTQERRATRVGRWDFLPRDIESAMASILERELDLQRREEILKRDCEYRHDYTQYNAYRSIDKYNDGRIDSFNLGQFFRAQGHYATERELLAVIRRIDTDGDAKISFSEWSDFLRSCEPAPRQTL